jgi:dTDP-4-dehydrorhamnose reductase
VDVKNSISHLDEFVEATYACYERQVPTGIYNVTNPGVITAREIVDLIKKAGLSDKEYRFYSSEAEFNRTVKAPRSNCVLSSGKLAHYDINLTEVHLAVESALFSWQK